MPRITRLILPLTLIMLSFSASALNSLWPVRDTPQSRLLNNVGIDVCKQQPPKPYTGTLVLDSKYQQTDITKSQLTTVSNQTQKAREAIDGFAKDLVNFMVQFETATDTVSADSALACMSLWLEDWGASGAVLSDETSNTGKAVRKWFLGAIGSVLLKAEALSNGKYRASPRIRIWLDRLADAVIADYTPRQTLEYAWFNNHDYWAAWSVAVVAMLNHQPQRLDFAETTLKLALQQGVASQTGSYLYWPLEVGRAELAVDYSNYALVPIALLSQAMHSNGRALSQEQLTRLGRLADFAVLGVFEPQSLPELTVTPTAPGEHKLNWVLPLLTLMPSHTLAGSLMSSYTDRLGFYGQIGGDLRTVYDQVFKAGD